MTPSTPFEHHTIDEFHRVTELFWMNMMIEIMSTVHKYRDQPQNQWVPVLIDVLREMPVPKYNKYSGIMTDTDREFWNNVHKPDYERHRENAIRVVKFYIEQKLNNATSKPL